MPFKQIIDLTDTHCTWPPSNINLPVKTWPHHNYQEPVASVSMDECLSKFMSLAPKIFWVHFCMQDQVVFYHSYSLCQDGTEQVSLFCPNGLRGCCNDAWTMNDTAYQPLTCGAGNEWSFATTNMQCEESKLCQFKCVSAVSLS